MGGNTRTRASYLEIVEKSFPLVWRSKPPGRPCLLSLAPPLVLPFHLITGASSVPFFPCFTRSCRFIHWRGGYRPVAVDENHCTHYTVTHLVEPSLPLTSKQKFHFGLSRSGQNERFVLMSTGGLAQPDVSPCMS